MEKKNNRLRYAAGECFIGTGLIYFIAIFAGSVHHYGYAGVIWPGLIFLVFGLIGASLLVRLPVMTSVCAGLVALEYALEVVLEFVALIRNPDAYSVFAFLSELLSLAFWIILIVMVLSKKSVKKVGFIAGGLYILSLILTAVNIIIYGLHVSDLTYFNSIPTIIFTTIVTTILLALGVVLYGIAHDYDLANGVLNKRSKSNETVIVNSVENQINRLFELKELLDKGIITQEEFDAKKKEVLDKTNSE